MVRSGHPSVSVVAVPRDPFNLPHYTIMVGNPYRLRADAPPASPGPLPPLVVVQALPHGKVEFADVEHPSSSFRLRTPEFREVFDPA